jgi:hypothetical protein
MEQQNFMKKSDESAESNTGGLEFPDWNGMNESSARITPEAASRLCEEYAVLFPDLVKRQRKKLDNIPEFIL